MKALVIQVSDAALPPSARPMAGVAIAPPEKLSGSVSAARHYPEAVMGLRGRMADRGHRALVRMNRCQPIS